SSGRQLAARSTSLLFGSRTAYSVVRFLKECAASGQATARIATDQISAASTGCCIGQACTMAEGVGLPQRSRAPATTALTGFQFATACSHPGMCWVGTKALDTNVSGNKMMKPNEPPASVLLEFRPTQADTQPTA